MRRYKGTFDVFFGIEHRLRKEEMEEQVKREALEVCNERSKNHGGKGRR